MTINTYKFILTTLMIGSLLLPDLNLNAQSKLKQSNQSDSIGLESFLTVQHDYVKIPITKLATGHLHIHVVLNGVDGDFILDTGAGAAVVETNKQNKFHLTREDASKTSGTGTGGTQSIQKSVNNTINLGGLVLPEFNIYMMNLDHVNKAFTSMGQQEVDGVIGADVLTQHKAIIDYSNLVLYLRK